jgi:hypothetical protein
VFELTFGYALDVGCSSGVVLGAEFWALGTACVEPSTNVLGVDCDTASGVACDTVSDVASDTVPNVACGTASGVACGSTCVELSAEALAVVCGAAAGGDIEGAELEDLFPIVLVRFS